ncbi:cupredoxin domain-containing protein [Paenibacillus sp. OV219]|uniref:cupredoxin domain-containing protein n=1 Tax=Paenibacillus sp. OV219 TaxID=1884377 RepID=UPI0008C6B741|nr:cupredoxin domain-containing protein [Paenibacillus sp. OV219]SEO15512.1 Cupredoxin-like domain-containing protein [Paenibacillus sp. OV219]
MSNIFVISRKQLWLFFLVVMVMITAAFGLRWNQSRATLADQQGTRVIQLVTGEFKTKTDDGKELEVYRFDPGTIVVNKGEHVELRITGVNGKSHPFVIHELGVKGEINKGQTTTVHFTAEQKGTYPILCLTHTSLANGGPMIGYIVVQ